MKRIFFLFALLCLLGCSSEIPETLSPQIAELNRMSFVATDEGPALFVDRYEVTNADFALFLKATQYRPEGPGFLLLWEEVDGKKTSPTILEDHPVVFVSLNDAQAFAKWKGKRLPNSSEWEKWICGYTGPRFRYPWSGEWIPLYSNSLELGFGHTTAVGTFESGKSIYGCYDVVGNVWEWVSGPGSIRPVAKGGSFNYGKEKSQCNESLEFDPGQRAEDLGFRCVCEFEDFLKKNLIGFKPTAVEQTQLQSLAKRWGSAAEPYLQHLENDKQLDRSLIQLLRRAAKGE